MAHTLLPVGAQREANTTASSMGNCTQVYLFANSGTVTAKRYSGTTLIGSVLVPASTFIVIMKEHADTINLVSSNCSATPLGETN